MPLCNYGCGQEAIHQFKNGKWCCSIDYRKCPSFIEKIRQKNIGKVRSDIFKKKMSKQMMGQKNPMFGTDGYWKGKKRSKEDIKKFKISHKQSIQDIKEKYPFFSKIEDLRYNTNKEIQVHCKNHNCPNSKEQDGWFTPTYIQLYERIRALEKPHGMIENNFYCSDDCKDQCPLYNLKNDPCVNNKAFYTYSEYQQFREFVLKRDNYKCQYCGEKAEHVHHERPQKLEPFFALDPDLAWSVCKKCHYKYGHKDECSTGNLANKICI